MRRYIVFAGDNFYPCGGWLDKKTDSHSEMLARAYAKGALLAFDWVQIVDTETGKIEEITKKESKGED